jgi:DNA polymerase-3 subunit beta
MKLSIERAALLRAVSQAQSVVERRNTIPILANVLIEAEGDTASFRATDLDIEVVDRIPAKVERAGATTVRRSRCTRSCASCPTARWSASPRTPPPAA